MDLSAILSDFVCPLVMVICLCVGYIVKNMIPTDKVNKFIPLIVAVLGIVISVWNFAAFTPQIIAIGLVSGLASTGLHQLFKNFINKEEKEGEE